jgi:hypothetical protein
MEKHARDLQHGETQTIHELAQIGAQLRDLEEKITPKPKKETPRKPRYTRKNGQWVRLNTKEGNQKTEKVGEQTNEILIGTQTKLPVVSEPAYRSLYFEQPKYGFFMVKSQDKKKEPKEEEPEIGASSRNPNEKLVETPDKDAFEGHYEE